MTPADRVALREQLIAHEGIRLRVYRDSMGIETVGVGRNLRDVGISFEEAMYLLDHDIDAAIVGLGKALPWSATLDPLRFRVLVDLAFNLGLTRLLRFEQMLDALHQGDYSKAADEMLDSTWAKQVGARAVRLAEMMRGGGLPEGTLVA